jgi:hypothetical protein
MEDTKPTELKDDKLTRWIVRTGWFLMLVVILGFFVSVLYLSLWFPTQPVPPLLADMAKVLLGFVCGLMTKLVESFTGNSYKA